VHLLSVITTVTPESDAPARLDGQLSRKIVVLLAAYNGAHLVCEQIRSIQRQTISNWTLLVRDDCSQDNTRDVLEKLALEDSRIRYVRDTRGHLGAAGNFGELMRVAFEEDADAIFFADQDDIWLPHKLSRQLMGLQELEQQYSSGIPLLCYSDLEVVDQNLNQIHPSFMRYEKLRHEPQNPLHVLLTQNLVTGCSVVINRSLLELATPIPNGIILHDWWLAICAAACGRIGYIDQPLVQYRQHSRNQIGALTIDRLVNFSAARQRLKNIPDHMFVPIRQAEVLSERIRRKNLSCSGDSLQVLDQFVTCLGQGVIGRLWTIYRSPLHRQGPVRKLLLFFRVVLMRNGHETKHAQPREQHNKGVLLNMKHDGASSERSQGWRFLASRHKGSRGVRIRTEEKKIV
jgi:glycosyltransferase involved in cell wall biosynthesis